MLGLGSVSKGELEELARLERHDQLDAQLERRRVARSHGVVRRLHRLHQTPDDAMAADEDARVDDGQEQRKAWHMRRTEMLC